MGKQWKISLRPHLTPEQLSESPYSVAKKLGMSNTTVYRFTDVDTVLTNQLSPNVAMLAKYYGLELSEVVTLVDTETGDEVGIYNEALMA